MRARAYGFSLIELMISITLGLIVLTTIATIFANTSSARAELQRTSQQVDNGRYAVDVLSEDLQLAGYFGELNVSGLAVPATLPDVCSTTPGDWAAAIPLHLQGHDDGADAPGCMPASHRPGTDIVIVRRLRTCTAGEPGCEGLSGSRPYLQTSLCGSAGSGTSYALGLAGDTAFPHRLKDCASAAAQRQYLVHIYFISNDNGSGAAIPTLKRLEFNGSGYTEVPLVEGIETLQLEYGLDLNGDGSPEAYTTDPTSYTDASCASCSPSVNWSNVVVAKLHIVSRALEPSPGYRNNKVYELGATFTGEVLRVGPFDDGFRRHVYSAAARIMNPTGRRETP